MNSTRTYLPIGKSLIPVYTTSCVAHRKKFFLFTSEKKSLPFGMFMIAGCEYGDKDPNDYIIQGTKNILLQESRLVVSLLSV